MKIAIAQTEIHFEEQADNLARAEQFLSQAADSGADAVFFPEMSFTGFTMHTALAASLGKTAYADMQRLASFHDIAVGFGWVNCTPETAYENHYTVLGKQGNILSDYVKIHPFSYGDEEKYYRNGNQIVSGVLCGMPFSTLICYDLRFPEVFRLAAKKAALLIVPANWLSRRSAHWDLLLRARAIENQVYVLGVNCVGTQETHHFVGSSCLVNPEGETLVQCGSEEQLALVDLENDVDTFRKQFPTYRDAKLSLYAKWYQNKA